MFGRTCPRPGLAPPTLLSPEQCAYRSPRYSPRRRCRHAGASSWTGARWRRSISAAKWSPKTAISWLPGIRTCVGTSPWTSSSRRMGVDRSRSGSLLAVSQGESLRYRVRRSARRRSPSIPRQLRVATSRRSTGHGFHRVSVEGFYASELNRIHLIQGRRANGATNRHSATTRLGTQQSHAIAGYASANGRPTSRLSGT